MKSFEVICHVLHCRLPQTFNTAVGGIKVRHFQIASEWQYDWEQVLPTIFCDKRRGQINNWLARYRHKNSTEKNQLHSIINCYPSCNLFCQTSMEFICFMKSQIANQPLTGQFIIFQICTSQRRKYKRSLRQKLIGEVSLWVSYNRQMKPEGN